MANISNWLEEKWLNMLKGTAYTAPTVYCGIVSDGSEATIWVASTVYSLGNIRRNTAAFNGWLYECTTAGTSDTIEPTWPTTEGATVADDSVVWTCHSLNYYLEAGTLTNEITGYTGDRPAITLGTVSQIGEKATVKNSAAIDFLVMPAPAGREVKYAIVCDADTAGNILYWCPLTVQKTFNADDTFRIPEDGLVLDLA